MQDTTEMTDEQRVALIRDSLDRLATTDGRGLRALAGLTAALLDDSDQPTSGYIVIATATDSDDLYVATGGSANALAECVVYGFQTAVEHCQGEDDQFMRRVMLAQFDSACGQPNCPGCYPEHFNSDGEYIGPELPGGLEA